MCSATVVRVRCQRQMLNGIDDDSALQCLVYAHTHIRKHTNYELTEQN